MIYRSSRLFATVPALAFSIAAPMIAQQNTGAVRGEVKDADGGKVRGATVTLTSMATRIERTATTNDSGIYQFGAVEPGDYKVSVTQQGFATFEVPKLQVALASTATVDAVMQVGGSNVTIEVSAAEPLLDTSSASGGQNFTAQQIQDLPNLGRNPFIFEKLDSNVTTMGDPRYVRAEDQTGLSQVSISGAPIGANNYVVDGIPISRSDGGVTFIPSPEAVSSAKVQANAYDAEVGRTGGGVFNTSLQSGSAVYHGTLFGNTRQTNWSGNVYFNPTKQATPDITTYAYAGAFGGPLPFMKKIKYLDNTFFWVTEEGYRQAQFYPSSSATTFVPTAAERNGDFSADNVALYDPNSPVVAGARTLRMMDGGVLNKIPASYISPVGRAILNSYPGAQSQAGYNTGGSGSNFTQLNTFKTRSDMYSGKLEHTFTPWYSAGISYVHLATQEPSGFILGGIVAENANKLLRYNDATAINNTFTINPTTLLTVGYGFNRYYSASFQFSNGLNPTTLGFPSGFANQLQSFTFPTTTISNVTNGRSLGGSNGTVQEQASKNIVVGLSKTFNRHNVKMGYVFRALVFKSIPNSVPSFTFNGQFTSRTPGSNNATTALAFADLLIGQPSAASYTLNSGPFYQMANYNAVYVQDDYRANAKLTLAAGIRYEYEPGQHEQTNRYNVGFDPSLTYNIPTSTGPKAATGGLLFAGQNGAPTNCCMQSNVKFSPRVGVAYQVLPKTVVHAGFGLFYAPVALSLIGQGYSQGTSYSPNVPSGPLTAGTYNGASSYLSNPFPSGFVQPSGNTLGPLTGLGAGLGTVADLGRRYPFVQQYSADVQQDLPLGINLKISYSGAHSRNIINTANINQISSAQLAADRAAGVTLTGTVPNPYYVNSPISGYAATGVAAQANISRAQAQLPFPQFTAINVSSSNGFTRYNALALKVQKRVANSLTVLSTYTWSSNWDNLWSAGSQITSSVGPQDVFNPKAEYARALNNVPNRFTAAFSYELPFGRGKKFLGSAPWYIDQIVGGWQLNDEWVIQNGTPLTISQTNQNTAFGTTGIGGTQRPNLVGDAHDACKAGAPQGRLGVNSIGSQPSYLNAAAFSAAAPFTYGNAPRLLPCQGPGSNITDMSLNKAFKIGEHVKAQFRAEALNAFNTPQFGTPASTLVLTNPSTPAGTPTVNTGTSQTIGNITSAINLPRIIQLGGRITF